MSAVSWWDHYGPAACVASFWVGFALSWAFWFASCRQVKRASRSLREPLPAQTNAKRGNDE